MEYKAKERTKILLHVFGGEGNRGVLDLSQFFHFASEDLEIKSNTPQVNKIQVNESRRALKEKLFWGGLGGAAEQKQT